MPFDRDEDWEARKDRVIGLGERSFRKSYYPQLRQNLDRLELFRALLDRTADFVVLLALEDGTVADANAAFGRLLGRPAEALIGRPFDSLGLADAAAVLGALRAEIATCLDGGETPAHPLMVELHAGDASTWLELSYRIAAVDGRCYGVLVGRDVTERKLKDDVLAALLAEKEALIENVLVGIVMIRHRRIIACNRRFEEIFGYAPGAMIGKSTRVLYADDDIFAALGEKAYGALARGSSFATTIPMARADGSRFWGELSGRALDSAHPDDSSIWIYHDVTERKAAEADRDLFSEALRQSSQPIVLADAEVRITYVNPAFSRLFGYSLDELAGQPVLRLLPPNPERLREYEQMRRHLDAHGFWSGEVERLARDGTRIPVLASVGTIRDDAGGVSGFVANYLDLRALKEKEASLRTLAQTVEQSPESIVVTDLDARIEYVNEAFVRNTGYSREEAIGQNPRLLQSGSTPPENYVALWQALTEGRAWQGEFHNRRKDGSEYVEEAIVTPIREADGRTGHYVAIKADITERKKTAEELERHRHHLEELVEVRTRELAAARDAAEAANRAKSAFVANMSHEIRTPMSGILGMANLMRRGGVTPRQAEQLDRITASGKHLLGIINDILDLSKIEAGKLELAPRDFALDDLLTSASAVIGDAAKAKGLDFVIEAAGVPQALRGDPTRLSQALINYLGNAVKFTAQGHIVLKVGVVEQTGAGYLLRFEVTDTGVGMTEEQRSRVFQLFEQADNSISRRYGGTGLGLAITRRIVELMGGEVGVDSAPGKGSRFWLTARLGRGQQGVPAERPRESAETLLSRRHRGRRVLLAEDDPVSQEVALLLLRDVGLRVDVARNGVEALRMTQASDYDLVLMDMQMPESDGLETTCAIRRRLAREALPIIAMTANAFAEDRARCLDAGMDDFIAKPVEPEALFTILLKWLPGESCPPAAALADAPASGSQASETLAGDAEPCRRLARVPGLDVARGLALAGGCEQYVRMLRLFVDCYGGDAASVADAFAAGDFAALQRRCHTLKGAAGNVGAAWLSEAAALVCTALEERRDAGEIEGCCLALIDELAHLLRTAGPCLPAPGRGHGEGEAPHAAG